MEAFGLGIFMFSACTFGVLIFHPDSYLAVYDLSVRNILMGTAMGLTAVAIFKSPWGKRSGAHTNPAVTATFYRLGKIAGTDAVFYVFAQFAGAITGVLVAWVWFGSRLAATDVNYVATVPGPGGIAAAFAGEFVIAFLMMTMVLHTSNHRTLNRFTPYLAGMLVALYITIESPISGMSMNPARTFGSAVFANTWTGWWIYFTAPLAAMMGAAELYVRTRRLKRVFCAKLDHSGTSRCIFRCNFYEINLVAQSTQEGRLEVTKMPRVTEVKGLF